MIQEDAIKQSIEQRVADHHESLKALEGLSFQDAFSKILDSLINFGFKLLIAILVFYVGRFIIRKLYSWSLRTMLHRKVDASLTTFVLSLIKIVLYFILVVTVIGILGIETSSFLAIFASAGVAVGLALSGTLQNFAGGVLILLLKPYRVGDYIETQGYAGTVKEIQIFYTVINTVDNKAIIIPNGGLSTGTINNYSFESYRRVDWTIGLSYGVDIDAASQYILSMLRSDDRIVEKYIEEDRVKRAQALLDAESEKIDEDKQDEGFCATPDGKKLPWWKRFFCRDKNKERALEQQLKAAAVNKSPLETRKDCSPFVGLNELADSSVNLVVRAWVHSSDYWGVYFEMNKRFYNELPKQGFTFPFPQLDVHFDAPIKS